MLVKIALFLVPSPVKRVLKRYLPLPLKRSLYIHVLARKETRHISSKESRKWLSDAAIPGLLEATPQGDILFVGVASYTWKLIDSLQRLEGRRTVTLDIDPDNKTWGAKNHIVGDVLVCNEVLRDQKFSVLVINGVLGWGVDTSSDITRLIGAVLNIMQGERSVLLIGWTAGTVGDLLKIPEVTELLMPVDIGCIKSRTCFEDGQVYDIFMRR